jgi:hypothetical protein
MKGGCVCLNFQPISVIMNDSNQLNKFRMSFSSLHQKGMQDYIDILEWHTFIWSAKTLLKTSNNVLFFTPTSLILLSKPLECKFLIIKINLIVFINTSISLKKSKIPYQYHKIWWFIIQKKFTYRTYLILFLLKIWSNLNKYY